MSTEKKSVERTTAVEVEAAGEAERPLVSENPSLTFILLIVPVLIALAGVFMVISTLLFHFFRVQLGPEWLFEWGSTQSGLMGSLAAFYFIMTFALLLAGFCVRLGMTKDYLPSPLMSKMINIGDTGVSMGLIATGFLGLTCMHSFMSEYAPSAMMGWIDRPAGFVVRGVTAIFFGLLSLFLLLSLMRLRTAWQEIEFAGRGRADKVGVPEMERYSVILEYVPIEKRPEIIRMLRQYIGVDPATAKGLINTVPCKVLRDARVEDAQMLVDFLMQEDARARMEEE